MGTLAATESIFGWGYGTNPAINFNATAADKLNMAGVARPVSSPSTLNNVNMATTN